MRRGMMAAIVAVAALSAVGCQTTPNGGEITVIRNGGPFDNHKIRQVVCPGSGNTWTGFSSAEHPYPDATSQRTYKFSNEDGADAKPIENLRTADGVKLTLSGTFFFKTAFDCSDDGLRLVKEFDNAFVNRPEGERPWENFGSWLNRTWKPILDANARDVVLATPCKEVVSSCALLARDDTPIDATKVDNKSNIARIEQAMAEGLKLQLHAKLGDDYFRDITFNMEQPLLPEVDDAIATAQKAFAKVADVRAERLRQVEQVKVEKQKRLVAFQKARGYAQCPSCARQDELAKLPRGIQTLVLGSGAPVAIGGK